MKLCKKTIQALTDAKIEFAAQVNDPSGWRSIHVPPERIQQYIDDAEHFIAETHGVDREEYLNWVASEGIPLCGAKTRKGRQCKNWVSGGVHLPIHEWLKLNGGYCAVHGGESSQEAHLRIYGRKKY